MKKPSKLPDEESLMTFWDHVEVLRKVIFSCLIPLLFCTVAAFLFKDTVFEAVMAPSRSDFILYRGLSHLAALTGITSLAPPDFEIQLINTQLVSQFMVHLRISLYVGIVIAAPYIIYRLFGFVAPALYEREKRYAVAFIASAALLFVCAARLFSDISPILPFSGNVSSSGVGGESNQSRLLHLDFSHVDTPYGNPF